MRRDGRRGTCSRYAHSRACRPQRADHIVQRAACRAQCMARTRKRTLAREVRGARAAARPIVAAEGVLCTDAAGQELVCTKKPAGQVPCRTQQIDVGRESVQERRAHREARTTTRKRQKSPPSAGCGRGAERSGAVHPPGNKRPRIPPTPIRGGWQSGTPVQHAAWYLQRGVPVCALFSCPCPLCSAQILPQCELRPTQYAAVGAARYMEASLASVSLCGGRQTKSAGRCADRGGKKQCAR